MKSRWKLIYAAIATTLLLTACGTSPETGNDGTNGSANEVETTDKGTVTENEGTETEVADESTSPDSQVDILKDAQLKESDEQNYAISVLPDYTLTSEEPGKDSLMVTGDEAVFMRIETVKKEDGTYDYLADNMIAVLEASSDGGTPTEVTNAEAIPAAEGIENAKVLSVKAETASITGIIFERDEMIVRLTIYDSPKEEHFERFLHMGETIVSK